jgi:two-component system response regulator ChvI
MNQISLYYRLKAINRNIKILFVSALDAIPELISILPDVKTTDDIIKKPVELDDFVNAVKISLTR